MSSGVGTCSADKQSSSCSLYGGQTGWLLSTLQAPQWGREDNEFQPLSQPFCWRNTKHAFTHTLTQTHIHSVWNYKITVIKQLQTGWYSQTQPLNHNPKIPPHQQITLHQEALLMLLLHCGRREKNTLKHQDPRMKANTWRAQKAGNSMQILSKNPPIHSPLRPYQYFEQGESIYMVLYFPILSSGGNPTASPEETNAPASPCFSSCWQGEEAPHTLFLSEQRSVCKCSRCVCLCVFVHCMSLDFTWTPDVQEKKKACLHARVCIRGGSLRLSHKKLPLHMHVPPSLSVCNSVCLCCKCVITVTFLSLDNDRGF